TDPAWVDTHTGWWDFGDASAGIAGDLVEENAEPDSTGTVTGSYAYSAPGDYAVELTVTDNDGGEGAGSATIEILTAEEAAQQINEFIQNLPDVAFQNNAQQRKNAFARKFNALVGQIEGGQYNEAIGKLWDDIRAKADGYVDGRLNNDWIIDATAQVEICAMADALIAYLETLR
ncbi:MAG: PKD domain-containing protein, partial [Rhodothermia bacterium]|nr:PKD domain-containing protein [Rhodothermia bacterium]